MASSSPSPSLVFVSGSDVTTWDCLKSTQAQRLYPHGGSLIADASWNHNAQVIATISAVSTDEELHNNVVLTAAESGTKLDSLQHNQHWNRPAGKATSVAFGGKSRYLTIGDDSGAVCLWDLKKRMRVRQFFHDGYAARQVSVDPTDTLVLSMSDAFLSVYNLREGNLGTTLDRPDPRMSFTKFHTSPIETYKTAVGTSDGSILVYDIQDRTRDTPLLHLERRHSKSVTGVAFSSVNPQLLASSSADGTLQFFDIRSGETIQELASLSTPITSLSMHAGGVHCAIGSEAGEVFVYDLRQNSPVASMYAHNLIKCLQFAPIPKSKKEKEKEIGSTPQSVTYDAPPADPGKPKGSYFGPSSSQMKTSPQKLGRTPSPSKSNMAMSGATRDTPRQESKSNVGDRYSASRKNEATEPKPNMNEMRDVVKDEVENLRDDVEEAIRNLHMDMIGQFHQQSQELNKALSVQIATIDRLAEENERLREENIKMKERIFMLDRD